MSKVSLPAGAVRAGASALALLAPLLGMQPALALNCQQVVPLAYEGQYKVAAELGRECGTPESLANGAGALSVYGGYVAPEEERTPVLREAVALATKAVNRAKAEGVTDDKLLALVLFQEGQALGRLAETLPKEERRAYADPVRSAFEEALEHNPNRWEAHAGLANWHAKVMVSADSLAGGIGAFFANIIYDATYEEAAAHRAAAAAIPKPPEEEKVFLLESAEIRLLLDEDGMAEAARQDLESALAIDAPNHLTGAIDQIASGCLADLGACARRLRAELQ